MAERSGPPKRVSMAYILGFSDRPFKEQRIPHPPQPPKPNAFAEMVTTPGGVVEWVASDGRRGKLTGSGKPRLTVDNLAKVPSAKQSVKAVSAKAPSKAPSKKSAAAEDPGDIFGIFGMPEPDKASVKSKKTSRSKKEDDGSDGFTKDQDDKMMEMKTARGDTSWAVIAEEVGKSAPACKARFNTIKPKNWKPANVEGKGHKHKDRGKNQNENQDQKQENDDKRDNAQVDKNADRTDDKKDDRMDAALVEVVENTWGNNTWGQTTDNDTGNTADATGAGNGWTDGANDNWGPGNTSWNTNSGGTGDAWNDNSWGQTGPGEVAAVAGNGDNSWETPGNPGNNNPGGWGGNNDQTNNNNGGMEPNAWEQSLVPAPAKTPSNAPLKTPSNRAPSNQGSKTPPKGDSVHGAAKSTTGLTEFEVKPDDVFSGDDLRLIAKILQQDTQMVWNRVSWRFRDKTGRTMHPDVFEEKITGGVEGKGSDIGDRRRREKRDRKSERKK